MNARKSVVAVESVAGDLRGAIRRALAAAEFEKVVPRGAPVALKVNLGWDLFVPGSITSPFFVEALIAEIRDHTGPLCLVEADQVLEDIEIAFRRSGMAAVSARTGVPFVNMERGQATRIEAPQNVVLKTLTVPNVLRDHVLVTVPVLKTHAKTRISGALKNQWGCLPKMRHEYHLVLDDAITDLNATLQPRFAIADLNATLQPRFAIMDATIGLEGNGPKSGHPRVVDRVLASADLVALDTVHAATIGVPPSSVRHLATSASRGLGVNDLGQIEVRGLHPQEHSLPFALAHHNTVSWVENLLRDSVLKRLVFDTPVFGLCLKGAKGYYRLWTLLHAAACWDEVLAHPFYGPLWKAARDDGKRFS